MSQVAQVEASNVFEIIESRNAAMGRPTKFDPELAASVLGRLMKGESLTKICQDEALPALSTIYYWMDWNKDFSEAMNRARAYHAHSLAARTHDLAEQAVTLAGQRESRPDALRVAMNGLQWLAGKYNPDTYGDKQTVQHAGMQGITFNLIGLEQPKALEVAGNGQEVAQVIESVDGTAGP